MLNIGGAELMIILLVALVFLGPQRLPEVARQLGQAVSSLRSLASGFQAELDAASRPTPEQSMTLDGPTDQDEAIKATQSDPFYDRRTEPFKQVRTDPQTLKEQARQASKAEHDEKPVSPGGPTDQRELPDSSDAPDSDVADSADSDSDAPGSADSDSDALARGGDEEE